MATRLLALAAGLLAWALALVNTGAWYGRPLAEIHRHTSRLWEDMTVATSRYVNVGRDAPEASLASNEGGNLRNTYKRWIPQQAEEAGIRPWQFWRTLEIKPYLKRERLTQRPYDDPGRAGLLLAGYHLLGGVAPYLGIWLGVLCFGPALVWLAWELGSAGHRPESVALPLLLSASGFVVETLGLPYSAVGFYVVAATLLVAFAAYALLAPRVSARGLLARALLGGVGFALCACCRSGTLVLAGGFLLAAAGGVLRARPAPAWRPRAGLALVVAAALLGPYALVRPPRHHGVWGDIWQGLGDFDRTRGHYFSDGKLRQLLRREGLKIGRNVGADFESDQTEAALRRVVLDDVRQAPGWYLGILARRVAWTLTQWKLHPYGPVDGLSIAPQTSANEGLTDAYYAMVAPLDVFGVGPWRRELRLEWLWLPPLLLVAAWAWARRLGDDARARRLAAELALVGALVVATLPIPVIFSTAFGLETQTLGLAYYVAAAFALGEAPRLRRRAA